MGYPLVMVYHPAVWLTAPWAQIKSVIDLWSDFPELLKTTRNPQQRVIEEDRWQQRPHCSMTFSLLMLYFRWRGARQVLEENQAVHRSSEPMNMWYVFELETTFKPHENDLSGYFFLPSVQMSSMKTRGERNSKWLCFICVACLLKRISHTDNVAPFMQHKYQSRKHYAAWEI